ncbi:hypothetical protein [Enterobacter roggenkampii]|uniref:hypothetical protein n=1 Tax=Enterobacter roggenkampii TaxID=1812935 RepID=UPI002FF678FD
MIKYIFLASISCFVTLCVYSFFPQSIVNFRPPKSCIAETNIEYVFFNKGESVLSKGKGTITLNKDKSAYGIYVGEIVFKSDKREGRTVLVNRTFEYNFRLVNNIMTSEIKLSYKNLNDTATDGEVMMYVHPLFEVGRHVNSHVFEVSDKTYASGEGVYPNVICISQ